MIYSCLKQIFKTECGVVRLQAERLGSLGKIMHEFGASLGYMMRSRLV